LATRRIANVGVVGEELISALVLDEHLEIVDLPPNARDLILQLELVLHAGLEGDDLGHVHGAVGVAARWAEVVDKICRCGRVGVQL
jgi:hypothetical protein